MGYRSESKVCFQGVNPTAQVVNTSNRKVFAKSCIYRHAPKSNNDTNEALVKKLS